MINIHVDCMHYQLCYLALSVSGKNEKMYLFDTMKRQLLVFQS